MSFFDKIRNFGNAKLPKSDSFISKASFDTYTNLDAFDFNKLKYKAVAERALEDLLNSVIDEFVHADTNSEDSKEAADDTVIKVREVTEFFKSELRENFTGNIYDDFTELTKEDKLKDFFIRLVTVFETSDNPNLKNNPDLIIYKILNLPENSKGETDFTALIKSFKQLALEKFHERFEGMSSQQASDILMAQSDENSAISRLGSPLFPEDTEGLDFGSTEFHKRIIDRYKQETSGFKVGLVTGRDAGIAMLGLYARAEKTADKAVFQNENAAIVDILYRQRQLGIAVSVVTSPSKKPDRLQEPNSIVQGVGFFNIVAKSLLGNDMTYDPEVVQGRTLASYSHYKVDAIDIDQEIEKRSFMVGSFNTTRGALGRIYRQKNGRIVLTPSAPHNFEVGVVVTYDLVKNHGLKLEAFREMTEEVSRYMKWVKGDRSQSYESLAPDPKYMLSGPQTFMRIQRALGIGSESEITRAVHAHFAINVITKAGLTNLGGTGKGMLDVLEEKLSRSEDSTITLYVSKGFKDMRDLNMPDKSGTVGGVGKKSEPYRLLMELQERFPDRFRVVETSKSVHAKSFFIKDVEKGSWVRGTGSPNWTEAGLGGGSRDATFFETDEDYELGKGQNFFAKQTETLLLSLQNPGPRGRKALKTNSSAKAENILKELKRNLSPDVLNKISVSPITRKDKDGSIVEVGSVISVSLSIHTGKGKFINVSNALSFNVFENQENPQTILLDQSKKILTPVIGYTGDGKEKHIEFSSSNVLISGLASAIRNTEDKIKYLLSLQTMGNSTRIIKSIAREDLRTEVNEIFKNFEGLPIGQNQEAARSFTRLVYGVTTVELSSQVAETFLNTSDINMFNKESDLFGRQRKRDTVSGFVVDLLNPKVISPEDLDRAQSSRLPASQQTIDVVPTFASSIENIETGALVAEEKQVYLDTLVRRESEGLSESELNFMVLAQSLGHEGPAKLTLYEYSNELASRGYLQESGQVVGFLSGKKLEALPQRTQTELGTDSGALYLESGTPAAQLMLPAEIRLKGSNVDSDGNLVESRRRHGTTLNVLLMAGVGEAGYLNAESFRGAFVERFIEKGASDLQMSLPALTLDESNSLAYIDRKIRIGIDGNWQEYDPDTGEYKPLKRREGQPLLEIGPEDASIQIFSSLKEGMLQPHTIPNPAFGIRGARLQILGISREESNGRISTTIQTRFLDPAQSSKRVGLAVGIKVVGTGLKADIFNQIAESINSSNIQNRDEQLTYNGQSLGTVGEFAISMFNMFNGYQQTDKEIGRLEGNMIHMIVGESIVKTGVAFLSTAAHRLKNDEKFYRLMLSMFDTEENQRAFGRILEDFISQADATGSKQFASKTLLPEIVSLLGGDHNESSLFTALGRSGSENTLLRTLTSLKNRLDNPNFETVSDINEKLVLAAAGALHVMQALLANQHSRDNFAQTFLRLSNSESNTRDTFDIFPLVFDWRNPIPLVIDEGFSVKMNQLSDRTSAKAPTNQSGRHAQTILMALARNSSIEARNPHLRELFYLQTLNGSSATVENGEVVGYGENRKGSAIFAGQNFEPLTFTFTGMNKADENSLLSISDSVRRITYGNLDEDSYKEEVSKVKKEIAELKNRTGVANVSQNSPGVGPNFVEGSQSHDAAMKMFELMKKHRLGGVELRVPVFEISEQGRQFKVSRSDRADVTASLLSASALTALQGVFSDFSSDAFNLHQQILRNMDAVEQLHDAMLAGKTITVQQRDRYYEYLNNIEKLKKAMDELTVSDVQRNAASLPGSFNATANTLFNIHGLKLNDTEGVLHLSDLSIENAVILGDEAQLRVLNRARRAHTAAYKLLESLGVSSEDEETLKRKGFNSSDVKRILEEEKERKQILKDSELEIKDIQKALDTKAMRSNQLDVDLPPWLIGEGFGIDSANETVAQDSRTSVSFILRGFTTLTADYRSKLETATGAAQQVQDYAEIQQFLGYLSDEVITLDPLLDHENTAINKYFKSLTQISKDYADNAEERSRLYEEAENSYRREIYKKLNRLLDGPFKTSDTTRTELKEIIIGTRVKRFREIAAQPLTSSSTIIDMKTDIASLNNQVSEIDKKIAEVQGRKISSNIDAYLKDESLIWEFYGDERADTNNQELFDYHFRNFVRDKLEKRNKDQIDEDVFSLQKKKEELLYRLEVAKGNFTTKHAQEKMDNYGKAITSFHKDYSGVNNFANVIQEVEAFGQARVDLLQLQINTFKQFKAKSSGASPEIVGIINNAIGMAEYEIGLLSNKYSKEELETNIKVIKEKLQSTNNLKDKQKYKELLRLSQFRYLTSGFPASENTLVMQNPENVAYALEAAGFDVFGSVADIKSKNGLRTSSEAISFVQQVQNLFSVRNVAEVLQTTREVQKRGLAVASGRSGSPLGGEGGIRGFIGSTVRSVNYSLMQRYGKSFQVDEFASRRTIFFHMQSIAIQLGDYDGDGTLSALIERYTFLDTLTQALGGNEKSLIAVERASSRIISQITKLGKAQNKSQEEINEQIKQYESGISRAISTTTGQPVSLMEEYIALREELTSGSKSLMESHVEGYLGLREGDIQKLTRTVHQDYNSLGEDAQSMLRQKMAMKLNTFASDLMSSAHQTVSQQIEDYKKQKGMGSTSTLSEEDWKSILDSTMNSTAELNADSKVLVDAKQIDGLSSVFNVLTGFKLDIREMQRYSYRVAFASTKLIGNWSNVQSLVHAVSTAQKFNTLDNIAKSLKELEAANVDPADKGKYAEHQKKILELRKQQEMANLESNSIQSFQQFLQQVSRNAIKPKVPGLIAESNVFEEFYNSDVEVRAIDAATAIVSGRSMFDHIEYGFNNEEVLQKLFNSNSIDKLIQVRMEEGGLVAQINEELLNSNSEYREVFDTFLNPLIQAAQQRKEAALIGNMLSGNHNEARADMANTLSHDQLNARLQTSALLYGRFVLKNLAELHQAKKYRNHLERPYYGENTSKTQGGMSRLTKMIIMQEQVRGGKFSDVNVFAGAVQDLYNSYSDIEDFERDLINVDPTGQFSQVLVPNFNKFKETGGIVFEDSPNEAIDRVTSISKDRMNDIRNIRNQLRDAVAYRESANSPVSRPDLSNPQSEVIANQSNVFSDVVKKTSESSRLFSVGIFAGVLAFGTMGKEAKAAVMKEREKETIEQTKERYEDTIFNQIANHLVSSSQSSMIAAMQNQNFTTAAGVVSALGFASVNMVQEAIEGRYDGLSEKVNNRTTQNRIKNYGGVLSSVIGAVMERSFSTISEEFGKRKMITPLSTVATSIQDEIMLTNALIQASLDEMDLDENQIAQEVEYIEDENGDPIPFYGTMNSEDVSKITDTDGNPVGTTATETDQFGIPEAYKTPQVDANTGKISQQSTAEVYRQKIQQADRLSRSIDITKFRR